MRKLNGYIKWIYIIFIALICAAAFVVVKLLSDRETITHRVYGVVSFTALGIALFAVVIKFLIACMALSDNLDYMKSNAFREKMAKAMDRVNNGGKQEDIDDIAKDYKYLLDRFYKGKISKVDMHESDIYLLSINDKAFDIGQYKWKMTDEDRDKFYEIQALLSGEVKIAEVQTALNNLFSPEKRQDGEIKLNDTQEVFGEKSDDTDEGANKE